MILNWQNNPNPVEIESADLPGADIIVVRLPDGTWGVTIHVEPVRGLDSRTAAREVGEALARRWMGGVS